eukprot:CAMPEP_0182909936 /NCGR_PEP_ID=MMETSP0034_2-20130328/36029_1 /TAXON_ID=156128 /ORGANISM="Nephroselmis pyriformis, Strain CCMP717" /LENGTH=96 /DNA_ID=CAMNT_0025046225 /DNA_START=10 /DNA_END=297 /DNA_ORIENTATION=+
MGEFAWNIGAAKELKSGGKGSPGAGPEDAEVVEILPRAGEVWSVYTSPAAAEAGHKDVFCLRSLYLAEVLEVEGVERDLCSTSGLACTSGRVKVRK